MTNIVVFLQNKPFLGNQIVQIPFFYFLKRIYHRHNIIVVAPKNSAFLLEYFGYIDELYTYIKGTNIKQLFKIMLELRRKKIEVAYTHRRHSIKTGLLARLSVSKEIIGYSARTTNIFVNSHVRFDVMKYIGQNHLSMIGKRLEDFSSEFNREDNGYFIIIPGGSFEFKKYPIGKYINIAKKLKRIAPVHFLLGKDMRSDILALSPFKDIFKIHIGKALDHVEKLVKEASVVISNDCGPLHFAHIYDILKVCLFASKKRTGNWFYPTQNSALLTPSSGMILALLKKIK